MTSLLQVSALVVLAVVAALAAASEAVVVHVSAARAATIAGGDGASHRLVQLLDRREAVLTTMLAVRLAAQVGMISIVVLRLDAHVQGLWWTLVAVVLVAFIGLVETIAKTLVLVRTDRTAVAVVPFASLVSRIPLVGTAGRLVAGLGRRGLPGPEEAESSVSEEELLAFAEVAAEAEVIEVEERALIESIITFGDTIVREVMVPRPDMISVERSFRVADVIEVCILNGFSRIPVIGDGIDDVVGIVYAKDLMRAERDGREDEPVTQHLRPPRFVPEQKRVAELLREMQNAQFHMAVVVDEYGGVAGLVTLEDLIEELVGEIVDEFDVEDPMAEPLPGGAYRVNARMPVGEVNDLVGAELPEGDWDTVGGLLFGACGHVPAEGESVTFGGHRLVAARVQGRRIGMVRIEPAPEDNGAR